MASSNHQSNPLERLAFISLNIEVWGGDVAAQDPDYKLGVGGKLPPRSLITKGRKAVIDKQHLRPFLNLREAADRRLEAVGKRFDKMYAVPVDKVEELEEELADLEEKWDQMFPNFYLHYDKWCYDWQAENPEYANEIAAGTPSKEVVKDRFNFHYSVFFVNGVNAKHQKKLVSKAMSLGDSLLDEVVETATAFVSKSLLNGKDWISEKTQPTIKQLRDKVDGLSFLDEKFKTVVSLLDTALSHYTGNGSRKITGQGFAVVSNAILTLSSKMEINRYINSGLVNSSAPVSGDFSSLAPSLPLIPMTSHSAKAGPILLPGDDELDMFFQEKLAKIG